jgi:hypothetical protein
MDTRQSPANFTTLESYQMKDETFPLQATAKQIQYYNTYARAHTHVLFCFSLRIILSGLFAFIISFHSYGFHTFGTSPWTGDRSVSRPLNTQYNTTQKAYIYIYIYILRMGIEPTIQMFEQLNPVRGLHRAATVIIMSYCGLLAIDLRLSCLLWNI